MHLGKHTVFPPLTDLPSRLIYPGAAGKRNRGEGHSPLFRGRDLALWRICGAGIWRVLAIPAIATLTSALALLSIITQPMLPFQLSMFEIPEDAGINQGIDLPAVSLLSKLRNLHHRNCSLYHSINSRHFLGLRLTNPAINQSNKLGISHAFFQITVISFQVN